MSFKGFLKANTTVTLMLGPMLDTTDGDTPEGALTLEDTEIYLSKNNGAFANPNDTNNATVDATVNAYYTKQINGTDTNTEGILRVVTRDTAALFVDDSYMVVNANVYDSLFAAATTDYLQTDVIQIEGSDATNQINAAVDSALDTAIPASPTAGSINYNSKWLKRALVNRLSFAHATGTATMYDRTGASLGTIVGAIETDGSNTWRLDMTNPT